MSKKMPILSQKKVALAGSLLLLAVFILPFISSAKHQDVIYVDHNASGSEDGSSDHPYKNIGKALDKADKGDQVYVRPGTYKENVKVPKEVELRGESQKKVIIDAKSNSKPTVSLRHKSKVSNLTINDGDAGVKVEGDSKVSIIGCLIKGASHSGIEVEKSSTTSDKYKVTISESWIKNNGWNGIYAKKSYIVVFATQIDGNGKDGIGVDGGSVVWVEHGNIKENGGSGMKLALDGSNVTGKNNRIFNNKREGVEINAYGGSGKIYFKSGKMAENSRYGIARVIRGNASSSVFSGLAIESGVEMYGNKIGNLSPIIRVQ